MAHEQVAISESLVPKAASPSLQHALDTYASETNKTASVWRSFSPQQMSWRPHPRSSTVAEIMTHQILSERRFFAEFLGAPELAPATLLPSEQTPAAHARRMSDLAVPRLGFLASQTEAWWLEQVPFFDVKRERIWIFWRRVLHTAHHRTQLTVYLRLLETAVPSTYGPTADVTWQGADPTKTVEAASRK